MTMSRRPATFTQSEIERAIRAVVSVGAPVAVELHPDKTIHVKPLREPPAEIGASRAAQLDRQTEPRL